MVDMFGFIGVTVSVAVLLVVNSIVADADNLYELGRVEYFQASNTKKYHTPKNYDLAFKKQVGMPEPLSVLLDNPNEENAKAYVAWLKQRQDRLKQAQELIEKVSHDATRE